MVNVETNTTVIIPESRMEINSQNQIESALGTLELTEDRHP